MSNLKKITGIVYIPAVLFFILHGLTVKANNINVNYNVPGKGKQFTYFRDLGAYLEYKKVVFVYGTDSGNTYLKKHVEEAYRSAYTDYLPLTGGTLTGALTGTSASFSSIQINNSTPYLDILYPGFQEWKIGMLNTSNGLLTFQATGSSTPTVLTLSSSGEAVFASSVTASKLIGANESGGEIVVIGQSSTTNPKQLLFASVPTSNYFSIQGLEQGIAYNQNLSLQPYGGNVGIGTTSPIEKLSVNGHIGIGGSSFSLPGGISGYGIAFPSTTNDFQRVYGEHDGNDASNLIFHQGDNGDDGVIFRNSDCCGSGTLDYMKIARNAMYYIGGNVGIGTTFPSEKLSVNGNIRSKKLIVTQTGWSDYVFNDNYRLQPLSQLEQYIKIHKHLPDIPSAKEVAKNGIDVGDNQALLLQKIEELTLYVIEMKKENEQLNQKVNKLQSKIIQISNKN